MNDKLQSVQQAFLSFAKRAEKVSTDILHETFVDTQPLTTVLSTANNQILYGRRGTGKTHALLYLSRRVAQDGQHSIYIDMRSVGSDGSIYNDPERSIAERSVRLALDVLNAIAIDLYSVAVEQIGRHANPGALTTRLDDLDAAINEVRVTGETTSASREAADVSNSSGAKGGLTAKATEPAAFLEVDARSERKDTIETSRSTTGRERVGLNFGRVQSALKGLLTHDAPGERYDAFKIDYGCYVELINTAKAPSGSLPADHGTYVDVPTDDYRSIRRAILGPEFLT